MEHKINEIIERNDVQKLFEGRTETGKDGQPRKEQEDKRQYLGIRGG